MKQEYMLDEAPVHHTLTHNEVQFISVERVCFQGVRRKLENQMKTWMNRHSEFTRTCTGLSKQSSTLVRTCYLTKKMSLTSVCWRGEALSSHIYWAFLEGACSVGALEQSVSFLSWTWHGQRDNIFQFLGKNDKLWCYPCSLAKLKRQMSNIHVE